VGRRGGLGRGLGALIPPSAGETASVFQELPVSAIRPNPRQPRSSFDEEAMASLTASIREVGVLQPVLVREVDESVYELIAGERRWRAARRAGLQTVPALVRVAADTGTLEQALVENLQREDLNAMDEAAAYQQLIEDFQLSQEDIAARVGKSRVTISNTLRLFQLPPGIQKLVMDGRLSAGHARALLGTPDRSFQESLARRAVDEGLSVRAVEDAVRRRVQGEASLDRRRNAAARRLRAPGLLELEELLSAHLDTRVKVDMRANKGRVVIEFATVEDLERIYRAMTGEPQDQPSTDAAVPPAPEAMSESSTGSAVASPGEPRPFGENEGT
jgi:ParB family chromosome partitioning protein